MGRRAELHRVEHAAEFGFDHVLAVAGDRKRLVHDFGQVVSDRTGAELDAIADDVVLESLDLERIVVFQRRHAALWHGEGVVRELDFPGFLVFLEHGEVDDPDELEGAFFDQAQLAAGFVAGLPGELQRRQTLVTGEEAGVTRLQPQLLADGFGTLFADVLGQRAGALNAAVVGLAPENVAQPGLALLLRPAVHAVTERAGAAALAGHSDDAEILLRDQLGENLEARAVEMRSDIVEDNRVAQVGLIRAIAGHGVVKGDVRERHRGHGMRAARGVVELGEQTVKHRLDRVEDVLLGDEAHLEVELVELAGAAVSPAVFIAETGCDLEVAVEARHHQQLLELLRGLRQGVELARVQARGHQKVARTLGRGRGQDRGLKLGEALLHHPAAQGLDHLGAEHDVGVDLFPAQVEVAVGQAQVFVDVVVGIDLQRHLLGCRLYLGVVDVDLDLAGGELVVHGLIIALHNATGQRDHRFEFDPAQGFIVRAALQHHALGDTVVIAQVDEQRASVLAAAVDPA